MQSQNRRCIQDIPVWMLPLFLFVLLLAGCASIQGSSVGGGDHFTQLTIATTALPNAQVSVDYRATLTASGGKTPYTWSLMSGTLPAGLSLNPATGAVSGTPMAAANRVSLTFQVQDSENPAQSRSVNLTLTVTPASLAITTNSLANGQVGAAYNANLSVTGGTPSYTWSLINGTLPAGLSLNASTGAVTGTPTATVASTSLTFQVQDSSNPQQTKTVSLTLTILPPPPAISTSSLPNGEVGAVYSTTLMATGGTSPYTWSISSGTLPAGLSLNASTGVISGTPSSPATSDSLTFKVTDSSTPPQSTPKILSLTITPATLAITTASLPNGNVGSAYSVTLAASGGISPYTWSLASGTLPAGLSLNAATGAITGTPTASVNNTPLTFGVQDSGSPKQNITANLTLTIETATLTVTTTSLPNGQVGSAYSTSLAATGGTTPYTWSITGGALPAGLGLNASTGAITGTPTAAVTSSSITFKVTDSGSPVQTAPKTLTITIAPATLTITTTSLPNGQVGSAYSYSLAAKGGTTPYTWFITSGALPAGLSLNPSTGAITGTPTTAVSAVPLTIQVKDSETPQQARSENLTLTIAPETLSITTGSLPSGQVGVAYSPTLAATGGTTPYAWSITSGTLPAGLSLNSSTGAITGTPTTAVTSSSITFKVTDSGSPVQTAPKTLTITIAPATLTITTTSLPNGQVGSAYSSSLAATGGTTPYTWSITSGTLLAGLSLNASTGAITGTPTTAVTSIPLTFQVQDSESPKQTKTVNLTLTIAPPGLAIITSSLPSGQVGAAYSTTLTASGGTTPFTWSITSGTLPVGLSLNASTGAITGTPTTTVSAVPLTIQVRDSETPQQTRSENLTLTIAPETLSITTASLPSGQVGVAYSTTLAATGGTTPYTWSITSGAMPAGLSLNASTGAITGTPTAAVTSSSITFKVTDSGSPVQTAPRTLTITIVPATLTITTTSLPSGQVGVAYSTTLAATGGTTPYTWSITSGAMPAGLSLNASTGAITGTPTAAVTSSSITFKVTDSGSPVQTAPRTLTITIVPATLTITTTSLPSGQVGVAYSTTLAATGGTTPYAWSITSGTLPPGLSLNSSTGAITGTPTAAVTSSSITFKVADSGSPVLNGLAILSITIAPATLTITTTSLPSGQVGVAYSTTLAATGGTTPYAWSITSGTLPPGLSLNSSTGAITGTPTAAVTSSSITFKVADSGSPVLNGLAILSITIAPATLTITTTSLPSGQVGVAYGTTLAATGGTTPYTWSITSGTLPAGLSLNSSTGAITGSPTAAVNSAALTFQVQDSESPNQAKTANLTLTITPATLAITTTSLPSGTINVAYSATLAATGGTTPYTWSLTSGTLPSGLSLNSVTGAITGTPTVSVTNTPLTFQVQDSGAPQQTKSVNLNLTIGVAGSITVSISPKRAGLTITQSLTVTATTNDAAGVTWSCTGTTCGTFSSGSSLSGMGVTYKAPGAAGVYTIIATSVTDVTVSASITFGVTDLSGVFTWHNNLSRDGTNTQEYALTPALVNTSTFGKLFTCTIDAAAYAQPLWVANVNIGGAQHNVVYVVTQHDTVYAFDADASPCVTLKTVSLLGSGETWMANTDVNSNDINPAIGIVGTPVIDPATNTLYLVAKSKNSGTFYQRLHALSLIDLSERANSPVPIASGGTGSFALIENQRPGLALNGSSVYVTWASHGDSGPYHGYIYAFDKTSLAQTATFNDTPSGSQGGIWMSGAAPAIDSSGNLYCITGNGTYDGASNFGDSYLKLSSSLSLLDYFTPSDQQNDENTDADFGSGGAAMLINSGSSTAPNLAVGGGKDRALYVLNRDNMGHLGDSNSLQMFQPGGGLFSTSVFWQTWLYSGTAGSPIRAFPLSNSPLPFGSQSSQSPTSFGWPGTTPSISSQGSTNGILWAIEPSSTLHAYDATNLNTELWNSNQASGDAPGTYVKFTVPTVANGKVYEGNSAQLTVYGLKPN
jgi:Putative Ig domain